MLINLSAIEKALIDVERLQNVTVPSMVRQREVALKIVENAKIFMKNGMNIPICFPKTLELLHKLAKENNWSLRRTSRKIR